MENQEGSEWQWEVVDSHDRYALVRDIIWWGVSLANFKKKDRRVMQEKARWNEPNQGNRRPD